MRGTILVVEDEAKLASLLADYLHQSGFQTEIISDGRAALPWVRDHGPDLILLDLMLPGRDGLEICKEIRSFSQVPIIIITARIEEIDRLLGLELGADDYICKPFSPREVVARVKSVLRRTGNSGTGPSSGLVLDESRYRAILNNRSIELTAVEFKLLKILATDPGRIYGREQLMDRIYKDERIVADRTIDSHVKKLRKKLSAIGDGAELIQSVYGVGYRFDPEAEKDTGVRSP